MKKFHKNHLFAIFAEIEQRSSPLDYLLHSYFRKHRAIGSKDRLIIAETVYGITRWRGLCDYLSKPPRDSKKRLDIFLKTNPLQFQDQETIPPHIRVSFPKFLFDKLKNIYGMKNTLSFCLHSNRKGNTTLRVNSLKTSRTALALKWENLYRFSLCKTASSGIIFHEKINLFGLSEFKQGLFEMQDEASQLVADHVSPKPGDHVLDFCAGSGGKTLAFAHKMKGKGQIYLYDIRPYILLEAKKRLKRAGIQNGHPLSKAHLKRKGLFKKMQWILLDVPCSGSGTLRRNPDMKWKIDQNLIDRLVSEQREIFANALKFLHPNGQIVYATCSVFPEENENQVSYFIEKYNLKLASPPFSTFVDYERMDGFFCAKLCY